MCVGLVTQCLKAKNVFGKTPNGFASNLVLKVSKITLIYAVFNTLLCHIYLMYLHSVYCII